MFLHGLPSGSRFSCLEKIFGDEDWHLEIMADRSRLSGGEVTSDIAIESC